MLNFDSVTPNSTFLHGTASFDGFCVKILVDVLSVDDLNNPHKNSETVVPTAR